MQVGKMVIHKSQAFDKLADCERGVADSNQLATKALRSHQGEELTGVAFQQFCEANGIQPEFTARCFPNQNGTAERPWCSRTNATRCMMDGGNFLRPQWEDAFQTDVYLVNRLPTRANNGETPHELWHGKKPDVSYLREVGSKAYVHTELPNRHQEGQLNTTTAKQGRLIGCCEKHPSFMVLLDSAGASVVTREMSIYLNDRTTVETAWRTEPGRSKRLRSRSKKKCKNRRILRLGPVAD